MGTNYYAKTSVHGVPIELHIGMSPCGHEFNNKRDRDHFLRFMDQVYERGRNAAKQELRDWLGVKS